MIEATVTRSPRTRRDDAPTAAPAAREFGAGMLQARTRRAKQTASRDVSSMSIAQSGASTAPQFGAGMLEGAQEPRKARRRRDRAGGRDGRGPVFRHGRLTTKRRVVATHTRRPITSSRLNRQLRTSARLPAIADGTPVALRAGMRTPLVLLLASSTAFGSATLDGRVTDRAGAPIAKATVVVDGDGAQQSVQTGVDGRYPMSTFQARAALRRVRRRRLARERARHRGRR